MAPDPEGGGDEDGGQDDIKARSANIHADPKMRELKHYMRSHQHEKRLRESAELEKRAPSAGRSRNLRAEGCDMMDEHLKKLTNQEAVVPYVAKTAELPEAFREKAQKPTSKEELKASMEERLALLRRMDKFETRLTWRDSMDHSLRRLMVDLDLSRDERLKEYQVKNKSDKMEDVKPIEEEIQKTRFAKARVDHLDKIFGWYEIHGMKEARKERIAPPYLRYNPQHTVMPGSMRVAPPLRELLNKSGKSSDGLGHSSSSPALLAAGSAATSAPLLPPPAPAGA